MSRSQLLANGMLLQRVGHLSSFRPAAGDLIGFFFLNIMKEVVCGPTIKHLLDRNVEDDATSPQPVLPTKNKNRPNTESDKQKKALKALEGFLSTDTAGDAASRLRSSTISIEDKNPAIDGDDSEPDNSIKPKGKTVKKPVGAKSQKNGQAKVNNFTGGNIHATLAVAKKNVLRGGKGGGGRKPRAAKKKTIEPVNPQPPPTTAVDLAAIAESKKMLDEMRKATQESKRANEELLRNSKALQQQREGKYLFCHYYYQLLHVWAVILITHLFEALLAAKADVQQSSKPATRQGKRVAESSNLQDLTADDDDDDDVRQQGLFRPKQKQFQQQQKQQKQQPQQPQQFQQFQQQQFQQQQP